MHLKLIYKKYKYHPKFLKMADPYTSVAWSFGGTKRSPDFMNKIAIPGPGTYELRGKGTV